MNTMRAAVGVVAMAAALVALAAPASAHVTVSGDGATQGGEAILTFHVPTESATASTTKLQVSFPTDTPLAEILVQPVPGWTATTLMTKLASPVTTDDGDQVSDVVSEVDWTADSAASAIKPGEFLEFVVSAGPMPKVASIKFPAVQTYSDGTVVKWIESAAPGSSVEPDHPAPVLTLAAVQGAAASTKSSSSSNTGPIVLSVIALVVAVAAIGFGVVSRAKGKS